MVVGQRATSETRSSDGANVVAGGSPPCQQQQQRKSTYLSILCLLLLLYLQLRSTNLLWLLSYSPLSTSSISIFVTMTSSVQVQPEHHSSSNNYSRNAIRQWQSWHTGTNTASERGPVIAIARWAISNMTINFWPWPCWTGRQSLSATGNWLEPEREPTIAMTVQQI